MLLPLSARVFFYLNAPSLVINKMPVKDIQLVHGQDVNIPLDEFNIKEMTADIEVHPPPFKPGIVGYRDAGHCPLHAADGSTALYLRREQLTDCLEPPERPSGCSR